MLRQDRGKWQSADLGYDGINVFISDGASTAAEHHLCTIPHHGQQIVLVHAGLVVRQPALLDDHGIQLQLLQCLLYDLWAPQS